MEMKKIQYTSLKYYNSIISDECMYVGMLFHDITSDERCFKYIRNFKRLEVFDDEADIEFIKLYLQGIKDEVESNMFNYEKFNIKEYIRYYVNEFKFTNVNTYIADDYENYVEELSKVYLKYDYNKSQRLSQTTEKQFIKKLLQQNNRNVIIKKEIGPYNDSIDYDFFVDNIAIKYLSFKDKNLKKVIPSVRNWAFTAYEMRKQYRTVFLYENDYESDKESEFNTAIDILKVNAEAYDVRRGLEIVLEETKCV